MKQIFLITMLTVLVSGVIGCDFFFFSTFPEYLPSVRKVKNLDGYFDGSNQNDYDMFVIEDDSGNDFVFVLYRPFDGDRKVVVLDSDLSVESTEENIDLGSLNAKYSAGPANAVVGSRNMVMDATYFWSASSIPSAEKDNIMFENTDSGAFYSLSVTNGPVCVLNWTEYDPALLNQGGNFFQIDDADEYLLENAVFNDNGTGDTADDVVILYLIRKSNNEGIALMIPAIDFPNAVAGPNALYTSPNTTQYFGPIEPGSVHIINNGMGVILERHDGTVVNYWYNGEGFDWSGETNGLQFKDRIVAYSDHDDGGYYIFDPGTKDIFKCTVWWNTKK